MGNLLKNKRKSEVRSARSILAWSVALPLAILLLAGPSEAGQKTEEFWQNVLRKYDGEPYATLLDKVEVEVEYTGETQKQDVSDTERGGLSTNRQASLQLESKYTTFLRHTRKYVILDAAGAEEMREIVVPYLAGQLLSRTSAEIVDRSGEKSSLDGANIQVRPAFPAEAEIYQRIRNLVFQFGDLPVPCVINIYYTIEGEEQYGFLDMLFDSESPAYITELVYNFPMEYYMLPWWKDALLNLRAENPEEKELTTAKGQMFQWTWRYKNLAPRPSEMYTSPVTDQAPRVLFSPNFKCNWSNLLTWYSEQIDNVIERGGSERVLHQPTIDAISGAETAGERPTDKEKVAAIYRYVQDTYSIFDIPLSRDGFVPNRPVDVIDLERIAPKDLSLVLLAMLRLAGIDAHYALISTRENGGIRIEFPALQQFNHAIVIANVEDEILILDPTDRSVGVEDPPAAIEGQMLLPVIEGEPDWLQIPSSGFSRNTWSVESDIRQDEEGTWRRTSDVFCRGELNRVFRNNFLNPEGGDPPPDRMLFGFHMPAGAVLSAWAEDESLGVSRELDYQYSFDTQYPSGTVEETGDSLTVSGAIFSSILPTQLFDVKPEERANPILLEYEERGKEMVFLTIPEGYEVVSLPDKVTFREPLGRMEVKYSESGGVIECRTTYRIESTELAMEVAGKLQGLFDNFAVNGGSKIILAKIQEEVETYTEY